MFEHPSRDISVEVEGDSYRFGRANRPHTLKQLPPLAIVDMRGDHSTMQVDEYPVEAAAIPEPFDNF
ncbi:hypothetical protein Q644_14255 [Brucella intermedia 229E]|uniref:Uncharacterized protein n=1 Tax=Brucella intermedia 229E TaxID=1337887 RepID=U4VCX9_9HYPH|nr:hypothetical protein Q644_14255 [Brucella intermedia 229E]